MENNFKSKFKVNEETGCWEWTAGQRTGYGAYLYNGKAYYAHRASYEMHFGPLEKGTVVRHMCNNKLCVNPAHLRTGTMLDNIQDMYPDKKIGIEARILDAEKSAKAQCVFRMDLENLKSIYSVMNSIGNEMSYVVNLIIDAAMSTIGIHGIMKHNELIFKHSRKDGRCKN